MADRYDLGVGLIQGLQQGLGSYFDASRAREDRELRAKLAEEDRVARKLQLDAELAGKGLIENPAGGFMKDPEVLNREALAQKAKLKEAGLMEVKDPTGKVIDYEYDPKYIAMQERLKKAGALANPFAGMSPGQKAADQAFGKEYSDWEAEGGAATVDKNLGLLGQSIEELKQPGKVTGHWTTKVPLLNSDVAQDVINPQMSQVRDRARTAIQTSLRPILGGQFAAVEGEAILNRAFNPRLSDEQNAERLEAELNAIRNMASQKDAAAAYFRENGTLAGFTPLRQQQKKTAGGGKGLLPGAANAGGQGPKKIKVSNGKESFMIDEADLAEAQAEGFKVSP